MLEALFFLALRHSNFKIHLNINNRRQKPSYLKGHPQITELLKGVPGSQVYELSPVLGGLWCLGVISTPVSIPSPIFL